MPKKTTEGSGAEPEVKDFDAKALDILNGMEGGDGGDSDKKEDPEPEDQDVPEKDKKTPGEGDAKPEDGAGKSKEEPKPDNEEELKIPRSRLNKEIEKKNAIQTKYDRLEAKIKAEKDRIDALSDDEKEEQENLKKLGLDTKLSKLQDKLEDMQDDLSDRDDQIKNLKETIQKTETGNLSKRIADLTKEMDGKDGLPKFDIQELIEFGKSENYMPKDPIKLYNLKYQAEIFAKKYEKSGTEMDKGDQGGFAPKKKKLSFTGGDDDFDKAAQAIIDSVGSTT